MQINGNITKILAWKDIEYSIYVSVIDFLMALEADNWLSFMQEYAS